MNELWQMIFVLVKIVYALRTHQRFVSWLNPKQSNHNSKFS